MSTPNFDDPTGHPLADRARALLAEAVGVADEKIVEIARDEGFTRDEVEDDLGCAVEIWQAQRFALIGFARELIARYGTAHPAPVPVGERPWEREGWRSEHGDFWAWNDSAMCWELGDSVDETLSGRYSVCLPHWALPLPGDRP